MTAHEAHEGLQEANFLLRRAVENALEMKAAATEIPASLEQVAEAITRIAQSPIEGDANCLKPELAVLRTRMCELQALLDGAAAFYCASIGRKRAHEDGGYTHRGLRAQNSNPSQLEVRI